MGFKDDPPTSNQLDFLQILGHSGRAPRTKAEASDLIDRLKTANEGKARARYSQDMKRMERQSKPSGCRRVFRTLLVIVVLIFGFFVYTIFSLMKEVDVQPANPTGQDAVRSEVNLPGQRAAFNDAVEDNGTANDLEELDFQLDKSLNEPADLKQQKISAKSEMRQWKDLTGQFSVAALAIALEGAAIVLEKENGQTVTVPIARLSEDDQKHIEVISGSLPVR